MKAEPLRVPAKAGEVWAHIDHFRKPNRRVWAVQYRKAGKPVYLTARRVFCNVPMRTVYLPGTRQPKAYLVAYRARVVWASGGVAAIIEAEGR